MNIAYNKKQKCFHNKLIKKSLVVLIETKFVNVEAFD